MDYLDAYNYLKNKKFETISEEVIEEDATDKAIKSLEKQVAQITKQLEKLKAKRATASVVTKRARKANNSISCGGGGGRPSCGRVSNSSCGGSGSSC